jgi:hypothetical protein
MEDGDGRWRWKMEMEDGDGRWGSLLGISAEDLC